MHFILGWDPLNLSPWQVAPLVMAGLKPAETFIYIYHKPL